MTLSAFKKIIPNSIKEKTKTVLNKFGLYKVVSGNYEVIPHPNFDHLRIEFENTWKDESIPDIQLRINQESWKDFMNQAPTRAIIECLKKFEMAGKSILEIGCSSGYYADIFKKAGLSLQYQGCDYSEALITLARKMHPEVAFKVCDARQLTYGDGGIDIAFSSACIMHVIDYEKAIAETLRVAKEYVIFHRTPILHEARTTFTKKIGYGLSMLEILFNEEEFFDLCNKHGLKLCAINTHDHFLIPGLNEPAFMKTYIFRK